MNRRFTDEQVEQQILLGGKISNVHNFFKDLAMLSPDLAIPYIILSNEERLSKCKNDDEFLLEALKLIAIAKNMSNYTEITKLSMILGDTRQRFTFRGLTDELRKREHKLTE